MSLDDFTPEIESGESGGKSSESSPEVSEKFKEQIKRSQTGTQKTQKDEKKAKKYDFILANFLVKFILNKKYDSLLDGIFKSLDNGITSNFLLGLLSLLNIEISNKIRDISLKEKIKFDYKITQEIIEFDDNKLDPKIKDRINSWIEDIIDICSLDYSNVQIKKLLTILNKDDEIIIFISQIFSFFFNELNISIKDSKSYSICEYIILEVKKSLKDIKIEEL